MLKHAVMKPAFNSLTAESALKEFVRNAYWGLRALETTAYHQIVSLEDKPYELRQHGTPPRPQDNWIRPINTQLFIDSAEDYAQQAIKCLKFLGVLKRTGPLPSERHKLMESSVVVKGPIGRSPLDRFFYTTVQAVGCNHDITSSNAQRPFGLFYQSFVHALLRYIGFKTSALKVFVPIGFWDTSNNAQPHANVRTEMVETDMVIGREQGQQPQTTQYSVWPEDSFATVKTSTKDRISQVFIDAVNIQRLSVWRIAKYVLFVHNDVQRDGYDDVSWTFLPTNFRSGSRTFPLSGIYFSDMPENVVREKQAQAEWARLCRFLSEFIISDLWV